jgi:hypothetical protein
LFAPRVQKDVYAEKINQAKSVYDDKNDKVRKYAPKVFDYFASS